jgi:hypothetical protein
MTAAAPVGVAQVRTAWAQALKVARLEPALARRVAHPPKVERPQEAERPPKVERRVSAQGLRVEHRVSAQGQRVERRVSAQGQRVERRVSAGHPDKVARDREQVRDRAGVRS